MSSEKYQGAGSFNHYRETRPELSEQEAISEYTRALSEQRQRVAGLVGVSLEEVHEMGPTLKVNNRRNRFSPTILPGPAYILEA